MQGRDHHGTRHGCPACSDGDGLSGDSTALGCTSEIDMLSSYFGDEGDGYWVSGIQATVLGSLD